MPRKGIFILNVFCFNTSLEHITFSTTLAPGVCTCLVFGSPTTPLPCLRVVSQTPSLARSGMFQVFPRTSRSQSVYRESKFNIGIRDGRGFRQRLGVMDGGRTAVAGAEHKSVIMPSMVHPSTSCRVLRS